MLLIFACMAGMLVPAAVARADSAASEAETLIRDGVALRRQQRDVQALPKFQKAYDLVRNPRTAGQLGLCELSLGYWIEAEQHLKEALATPAHPWVAKNQESLEASLKRARSNIGEVAIAGSPDGAQIFVNGHNAGVLPSRERLRLARGVADVELRATGYVTAHRSLTITAEPQTIDIQLVKERPVVVEAPKPPEPKPLQPLRAEPGGETPHDGQPDTGGPNERAHPGRALRWTAVGTSVLALAALGGAAFETARWQSGIIDFDNHKANGIAPDCQTIASDRGGAGCKAIYDRYTSAKQLAIVGYAVGGALAVTSLTLFLVAPSSSSAASGSEKVAFGCAPNLLDPGVACRFRF